MQDIGSKEDRGAEREDSTLSRHSHLSNLLDSVGRLENATFQPRVFARRSAKRLLAG
jgi:hypothetical protein